MTEESIEDPNKKKKTHLFDNFQKALAIALISVLTIEFNFLLEKYRNSGLFKRGVITFIFSFLVAIFVFIVLGLIFNDGNILDRLNGHKK